MTATKERLFTKKAVLMPKAPISSPASVGPPNRAMLLMIALRPTAERI